MSEIATEVSGAPAPIATVEFLGATFNERRHALKQVEAFKMLAEQALIDSVTLHVDQPVNMTFRPSSVALRQYNVSFPCYSIFDEVREPVVDEVTVRNVDESSMTARVTAGELADGKYDKEWTVRIQNILALDQAPCSSDE